MFGPNIVVRHETTIEQVTVDGSWWWVIILILTEFTWTTNETAILVFLGRFYEFMHAINELLWTPVGHVHPLPTHLGPQYIYIHHYSVQIVRSYYQFITNIEYAINKTELQNYNDAYGLLTAWLCKNFVSLYGTLYFCTRNDACGLLAAWLGKKLYFYIWTLVCLPRALRIWDHRLCNDSLWHGNSSCINGSGTIMFFSCRRARCSAAAVGLAELRVSNWRSMHLECGIL